MKRLLLLILAACGGGSSTPDATDGNANRPDATDDFDHDGVPDATDNCPSVINVNQGNEDEDKFGDACDPCPVVADDNPANADGDEVADACDPQPMLAGDHIRYFEGFHTAVPAGWEEIGTWAWSSGSIGTTSTTAGFGVVATERTHVTVSAMVVFDTPGSAGVVDNKLVGGTPAVACVINNTPAIALYSTTDAANAATQPFELIPTKGYVVKLRRHDNDYTCSAEWPVAGGAMATTTKTISIDHSPWVSGLIANNAQVRFHWFMVVESF
jgi:hypothetical protein